MNKLLNALSAVSNPQAMLQQMLGANPQALQQAQTMLNGKSDTEAKALVLQLAKQQGIDILSLAKVLGIRL